MNVIRPNISAEPSNGENRSLENVIVIHPKFQDDPTYVGKPQYLGEKLSMLLLRMHVHPMDAAGRLASEAKEFKFLSSSILSLDLDKQERRDIEKLRKAIFDDKEHIYHVRSLVELAQ